MTSRFLTARWRLLAMLNYRIEPQVLKPLAPRGTELDFWKGECFVSVVGFLFWDTRVLGIAFPLHANFEEVNLRFYVRHKAGNEWRRGVCFVRELVPRPAIAMIANTLYNERYRALAMRHEIDDYQNPTRVEYSWRLNRNWNFLRVETGGAWRALPENSPEEFIAEHYWGYSAQRDGGAMQYRVAHPRWRMMDVTRAELQCDVAELYGEEYSHFLSAAPASAFLAEGSQVEVFRGARL